MGQGLKTHMELELGSPLPPGPYSRQWGQDSLGKGSKPVLHFSLLLAHGCTATQAGIMLIGQPMCIKLNHQLQLSSSLLTALAYSRRLG